MSRVWEFYRTKGSVLGKKTFFIFEFVFRPRNPSKAYKTVNCLRACLHCAIPTAIQFPIGKEWVVNPVQNHIGNGESTLGSVNKPFTRKAVRAEIQQGCHASTFRLLRDRSCFALYASLTLTENYNLPRHPLFNLVWIDLLVFVHTTRSPCGDR